MEWVGPAAFSKAVMALPLRLSPSVGKVSRSPWLKSDVTMGAQVQSPLLFTSSLASLNFLLPGFTFAELTPTFVEKELQRGLSHFEDLGGLGNLDTSAFKLPPVGNLLLEQVLIRIEYALGFSEWEVLPSPDLFLLSFA